MNNTKEVSIAEFLELPSLGKVYREELDPQIKLRSMTLMDEMRRLSPSDKPYQNLCSVIDGCIEVGPDISSYDMCLGDYQYLLYNLRTITYGDIYKGEGVCPYCNDRTVGSFSLDDLPVRMYTDDIEKYRTFELPDCKKTVKIRLRTPRILDTTAQKLKDFKQKNMSINGTLLYSIESVIEEINGTAPDAVFTQEWIKNLSMKDINYLTQCSDKLDASIGIDNTLFYTCGLCGFKYSSTLKTDNEFFRPTLDI